MDQLFAIYVDALDGVRRYLRFDDGQVAWDELQVANKFTSLTEASLQLTGLGMYNDPQFGIEQVRDHG